MFLRWLLLSYLEFSKEVIRHTNEIKNAWPSWLILPLGKKRHRLEAVPTMSRSCQEHAVWKIGLQLSGQAKIKERVSEDTTEEMIMSGPRRDAAAGSVGVWECCVTIGQKHVTLLPLRLRSAAEQPPSLQAPSFSHTNVYHSSSPPLLGPSTGILPIRVAQGQCSLSRHLQPVLVSPLFLRQTVTP